MINFIVINSNKQIPLLGLKPCLDLKLISRIDSVSTVKFDTVDVILNEYKEVFQGLGKFPSEYKIVVKDDAVPRIQPLKRVPYPLRDKLKEKLNELEKSNVIKKGTETNRMVKFAGDC